MGLKSAVYLCHLIERCQQTIELHLWEAKGYEVDAVMKTGYLDGTDASKRHDFWLSISF